MKEQNYQNHSQYVFGFHFVGGLMVFAFLGGAITNLIQATDTDKYDSWLLVLAGVIFPLLYWYLRVFALKAQDRAIRAEESLRYYILTGKRMDSRINIRQIIALRFASDEEFPALVQKSADEKLSAKEIKKRIANWREDKDRV